MSVDFEAEGLLEGVEGREREVRLALLRELHADGVPLEELRRAVREGRLALLPVERALEASGPRYTLEEVAQAAGVDAGMLRRYRQALGLPIEDESERVGTEGDMEAARRLRILLDAGLPEAGLLEVTRVIGLSMSQVAAASRAVIIEAYVDEDDTELDVARRFVAAAVTLRPLLGEILEHALRLHLLEQVRHDVLDLPAATRAANTTEITACFADLVGFTRLGERLPVDELGAVTGRLAELASEAAHGGVRLVKLIGDGALLVGADNEAVVEAGLELLERAEADPDFPQLRVGMARGPAITRAGDWYGPPVNAAARITAIARPGSILVDESVKRAISGDAYTFSYAGSRKLKGMREEHRLYRLRRARI
jgi:adenylate cyclase